MKKIKILKKEQAIILKKNLIIEKIKFKINIYLSIIKNMIATKPMNKMLFDILDGDNEFDVDL